MSSQRNDRRYGVLGASPGLRAWGDAHPVGMAAAQGLLFGILLGAFIALTSAHHSFGYYLALGAGAGVLFGLTMWAVSAVRRRRTDSA